MTFLKAYQSRCRTVQLVLEPIDFSHRDEEFLSSDFKQKVLAFSIIWGIIGFALSAWVFLGKKVGPASLVLDRRQAEGRVVDSSTHGYSGGGESSHSSSFSVRPYVRSSQSKLSRYDNLVPLKSGHSAPVAPKREVTPTPKPKRVEVTAELPTSQPVAARPVSVKPPEQVARENVDRLLYPVMGSRPERSNLTAVARQVEKSMLRMANVEGQYHVGLVFDGGGKALVSDSFLSDGSLSRIWIEGRTVQAEVLNRDPEYGLAVISLPPGRYGPGVPLAPVPPTRGEELIAFAPSATRCLPVTVRAGASFGSAGFLVEGCLSSQTWGTPLFNDRGELIGCQFSSLPDFPGSGVHLAADSSALYRVTRGYSSSDTGAYTRTRNDAYARLTSLAGETRDENGVKKGRILAKIGVSQFFIGMSPQEAGKWINTPHRRSVAPGVENWVSTAPPMELVFVNGRLVAVATDFSGFSTVTGLSMGARVDRSILNRNFEKFFLVDGLALTPGLDILLDREGKARQFVVRPEL